MEKTCPVCGKVFPAKYKNRVYCSDRCRKSASRHGIMTSYGDAVPIVPAAAVDDVARLASDAMKCAHGFEQASKTAPYQLRAACERIGRGIEGLLRDEGWI